MPAAGLPNGVRGPRGGFACLRPRACSGTHQRACRAGRDGKDTCANRQRGDNGREPDPPSHRHRTQAHRGAGNRRHDHLGTGRSARQSRAHARGRPAAARARPVPLPRDGDHLPRRLRLLDSTPNADEAQGALGAAQGAHAAEPCAPRPPGAPVPLCPHGAARALLGARAPLRAGRPVARRILEGNGTPRHAHVV